jgi:hypothetical protein
MLRADHAGGDQRRQRIALALGEVLLDALGVVPGVGVGFFRLGVVHAPVAVGAAEVGDGHDAGEDRQHHAAFHLEVFFR